MYAKTGKSLEMVKVKENEEELQERASDSGFRTDIVGAETYMITGVDSSTITFQT